MFLQFSSREEGRFFYLKSNHDLINLHFENGEMWFDSFLDYLFLK